MAKKRTAMLAVFVLLRTFALRDTRVSVLKRPSTYSIYINKSPLKLDVMKKLFALLIATAVGTMAYAQDDDIYFVPSKSKTQVTTTPSSSLRSSYEPISRTTTTTTTTTTENWAEGRGNNGWDVDAYNRRGTTTVTDTAYYTGDEGTYIEDQGDGECTTMLVRFHSPRFGIYVSSPYYGVLTDYYWDDPWYWDYGYYGGWYGWNSWYGWGWGWHPYWHSWWADPWWGGHWGYAHWGHGPGWGGGWNPRPDGGRGWAYRAPDRGINNGVRPSRSYASGGRSYGTSRASRSYNNPSYTSGRSFGTSRSSSTRPSRSYNSGENNSSRSYNNSSSSRPSRSYNNSSSSSRSFNSSSHSSSPSRSSFSSGGGRSFGGGGGGRSFGGGGGRSGGGRR